MKKWFKFTFILILFFVIVFLYAKYIGTMGFITKEYTIYSNNLPTSFDGLKIVHFSDLHYNYAINEDKVTSVIEEINLIDPDIVVFTGDIIDKDVYQLVTASSEGVLVATSIIRENQSK